MSLEKEAREEDKSQYLWNTTDNRKLLGNQLFSSLSA